MRRLAAIIGFSLLLGALGFAQNWKQVHKTDEAKWAKRTGLDPLILHKMARAASQVSDERDDESRIANIDLQGLAERHDVLFVTYAGENNCLTLTVFRQLTEDKFNKIWSADKPPDGAGFCDNRFGSASTDAEGGQIFVRVPHTAENGAVLYTQYTYAWNGITYRLADEKLVRAE